MYCPNMVMQANIILKKDPDKVNRKVPYVNNGREYTCSHCNRRITGTLPKGDFFVFRNFPWYNG